MAPARGGRLPSRLGPASTPAGPPASPGSDPREPGIIPAAPVLLSPGAGLTLPSLGGGRAPPHPRSFALIRQRKQQLAAMARMAYNPMRELVPIPSGPPWDRYEVGLMPTFFVGGRFEDTRCAPSNPPRPPRQGTRAHRAAGPLVEVNQVVQLVLSDEVDPGARDRGRDRRDRGSRRLRADPCRVEGWRAASHPGPSACLKRSLADVGA